MLEDLMYGVRIRSLIEVLVSPLRIGRGISIQSPEETFRSVRILALRKRNRSTVPGGI
jgi:hypothetical protein